MPTVLIVGASRGIGCELARQYLLEDWKVHITTRDAKTPDRLKEAGGDLTVHKLDVRNADQIAGLAKWFSGKPIDVLIIAAGIFDRVGGVFSDGPMVPTDEVFAVNTEAPINIAEALFPNMIAADLGRMVFISSAEGIRATGREQGPYGQSKAALNDEIQRFAADWYHNGVIGIAMHPGWVATDMGGPRGPVTPQQSANGIREVVAGLQPDHCGTFLDFRGNFLPW
ncbi:short-chain dehydrogenase [Actibacterium atlanticum]|uniref:Short-chain dehydrogenase n=1 Tax=Actibacterium atlanticum TaxID=1461693 RepID=A0A058ZIP9_9RHOB|nr:SDR family NAD(P)-dependent oxidoreductase [Actibacterium atlanticum]KCV81448.1 short-chain dehydrogenase [Actibacterium atlanticum]